MGRRPEVPLRSLLRLTGGYENEKGTDRGAPSDIYSVYRKLPSRELTIDDGSDKIRVRFRGFEE